MPFDPLTLLPHTWLRFDDLNLDDNDPIATATDLSGNGNNWTQGTGSNQPLFKASIVNGHGVARFDGLGDHLLGTDLSAFTAGEIFLVIKVTLDPPVDASKTGLGTFSSDGTPSAYPFTDGVVYDSFGSTARKTTVNPTPSLSTFRLYNAVSIANEWSSYLDGTQIFTTGTNTVGFTATPQLGSFGGLHLDGDIAEMFLLNRQLDEDTERGFLKGYFQNLYGLTISGATFPPEPLPAAGGVGHRRAQPVPHWWRNYLSDWIDELAEREDEHRRLKALADEEEAEKRAKKAKLAAAARRIAREQEAAAAAEIDRQARVEISKAVKGARATGEAERAALGQRAQDALGRVEAKRQREQVEAEAEELQRMRQIVRSGHRPFRQRVETAIDVLKRQGWRAKN